MHLNEYYNEDTFIDEIFILMHKWGLDDWNVNIVNDDSRAGVTYYSRKEIAFSRTIVEKITPLARIELINHEIAHAIAGHEAGHGKLWQKWAMKCGARPNPEMCLDGFMTKKVEYFWQAECERGHKFGRTFKPKRKERRDGCPHDGTDLTWHTPDGRVRLITGTNR